MQRDARKLTITKKAHEGSWRLMNANERARGRTKTTEMHEDARTRTYYVAAAES